MENLFISQGEFTPKVSYNVEQHLLEFEGFSRPEDVRGFYEEIIRWIEVNKEHITLQLFTHTKLKITFKLAYFNSASSKFLIDIVLLLKLIYSNKIEIEWFYEEGDDEMLDAGQELSEAIETSFVYFEGKINTKR